MSKLFDPRYVEFSDHEFFVRIILPDVETFLKLKADPVYMERIAKDHLNFADRQNKTKQVFFLLLLSSWFCSAPLPLCFVGATRKISLWADKASIPLGWRLAMCTKLSMRVRSFMLRTNQASLARWIMRHLILRVGVLWLKVCWRVRVSLAIACQVARTAFLGAVYHRVWDGLSEYINWWITSVSPNTLFLLPR